jgi:tetratricopeptide (TPR) repeat protein
MPSNSILLNLAAALVLSGCASAPKPISSRLPTGLAPEARIDAAFVPMEKNLCGPTVLKMAAEVHQAPRPLSAYKRFAFTEKLEGSLKSDMISAARRFGLAPYKLPALNAVFEQVADGQPVVVFQNLSAAWLPAWHYSLVVGYSAKKNSMILHGGKVPFEEMRFERFMATWDRGGNWAYVLMPPERIPSFADFKESVDNAVLFEILGRQDLAMSLYRAMSAKWPDRFEPLLGIATIQHKHHNRDLAIKTTHRALKLAPDHPALLFNLAVMHFENGDTLKAKQLKAKLFSLVSEDQAKALQAKIAF